MIHCGKELVDGVWPERVAYLWPIKGNPYDGSVIGAVIGDVGELKTFHRMPLIWRKRAGHAPKLAGSRLTAHPRQLQRSRSLTRSRSFVGRTRLGRV